MHFSFWIILWLASALILGPIMLMRPSATQKRKEKLRLYARSLGLSFTQRQLPSVAGDLDEQASTLSVYFVPPKVNEDREDWLLMRANYEHEMHLLGHWTWGNSQKASASEVGLLKDYLAQLPEDVKAVSGGRGGYAVYWTERGDNDAVNYLAELLNKLQQLGES